MKLIVTKQISNKNNRTYYALVLDLEYEKKYLTFDKLICLELLGISPKEVENLPLGEYIIMEKGENV